MSSTKAPTENLEAQRDLGFTGDYKAIYRAEIAEAAAAELEVFEPQWGKRYPGIGQAWQRAWDYVVPPFAFSTADPQCRH